MTRPIAYCICLTLFCACSNKGTGSVNPDGGWDSTLEEADAMDLDPDVSASDAAKLDAPSSETRADTTSADAGKADSAVCDHTMENLACWQHVTLGSFDHPFTPESTLFDGRYLSFVQSESLASSSTLRYDTTTAGDFASRPKGAWTSSTTDIRVYSLASDGRYTYLLPTVTASLTVERTLNDSIVERFDPQNSGSTEKFNLSKAFGTTKSPMPGFRGGAFDGRYLYFAPSAAGSNTSGIAARLDTQAEFTSAAAWSVFDLTTLWPNANGFRGGIFDGRYVYFVPYVTSLSSTSSDGVPNSLLVRFDSTADFQSPGAWESFDLSVLDPAATGYAGGTFDGRYVYLSPNWGSYSKNLAVRFDTTASFASASSFSTFNLHSLKTSTFSEQYYFRGATFDGKYVYFSPEGSANILVRFEKSGDFTSKAAWQAFGLYNLYMSFDPNGSIAFDGRYVYVSSDNDYSLYRFDATATQAVPPLLTKSFL
jgi:hypothetical protein